MVFLPSINLLISIYTYIRIIGNNLDQASAKVDQINKYVTLDMLIDKQQTNVVLTPFALDALLENLKSVRSKMLDLQGSPFVL